MSWGADLSKNPQSAETTTEVTTTRTSDSYNKTFSYVYSPSTTTTAGDAKSDTKMLIVAAVAGLLILLGVVAARS